MEICELRERSKQITLFHS